MIFTSSQSFGKQCLFRRQLLMVATSPSVIFKVNNSNAIPGLFIIQESKCETLLVVICKGILKYA